MKPTLRALYCALLVASVGFAQTDEIEFAGLKYRLGSSHVAPDGAVTNEYVPENESIDAWSTLLAVRHWPKATNLRSVVSQWLQMVEPLLTRPPQAYPSVGATNEADRIAEAWLAAPDKSYIEVNLHRFLREEGTPGIKAYQFAQKIKMTGGQGDATPFMDHRDSLIAALSKLSLAAFKSQESVRAELKTLENELAELRAKYTDRHPEIRAKLKRRAELQRELDAAGQSEAAPAASNQP